jgi:hypothetical protein
MNELTSKAPSRQIVVLDANALMMPFQFGLNLDLELGRLVPGCEMVVPSSVIEELKAVLEKTSDPHARSALSLATKYRCIDVEGAGDEAVLDCAISLHAVLVTNDRGLRARAQAAGLKVIGLRGKNHLEFL